MQQRRFSVRQPRLCCSRFVRTLLLIMGVLVAQAHVSSVRAANESLAARLWEQHLPFTIAAGVALVLQGALINWLVIERRRRRRFEAEARERMSQLAHLNRVATAGELSASITHELTQPITGMVAGANAALRWLAAPTPQLDKARSALAQVVSAGDRTTEIIHGIRAMFRKEPEARRPVDINELIRVVLQLVHGDLERHEIVLETELGVPSAPVSCDYVQLQQVVLNLTINAIESMNCVGTRPRVLRLCTAYSARDVLVSIADVGMGVRASDLKEIFKPMYTTKSRGMGMGLAISRSIIEANNGHIWVSSNDGQGAVFHFVLPTGT